MSNLQQFNQTLANPKTQEYLQQVLADKKTSFVNNITALVANSQNLQACEPVSLLYAGIKATALDLPLDPNLGLAYVIPYNNNKTKKTEAQFQIGYKGFVQLAIRSSQFKTLNVVEVKEGELQEGNMLTGEIRFKALPDRENLPTIGYAAFFRLINGFEKTLYMTTRAIEAHAKKYSQSYSSKNEYIRKSSKWTTDFDAMAKKTVLKLLLSKYAPLSVDMQTAITHDQAIITEQGVQYVDNTSVDEAVAEEIRDNANQTEIDIPSTQQPHQPQTADIFDQQQQPAPQKQTAEATPGF